MKLAEKRQGLRKKLEQQRQSTTPTECENGGEDDDNRQPNPELEARRRDAVSEIAQEPTLKKEVGEFVATFDDLLRAHRFVGINARSAPVAEIELPIRFFHEPVNAEAWVRTARNGEQVARFRINLFVGIAAQAMVMHLEDMRDEMAAERERAAREMTGLLKRLEKLEQRQARTDERIRCLEQEAREKTNLLAQREQELNQARECKICFRSDCEMGVSLRCGHIFCLACLYAMSLCPLCRADILRCRKVYL